MHCKCILDAFLKKVCQRCSEVNRVCIKCICDVFLCNVCKYSYHVNSGSYMSVHVLLNLLNELGEKVKCEALPSNLSVFSNEINNSIIQELERKILFIK